MNAFTAITAPARRIDVGHAIAVGFRLLGWSAVTVLVVAGLFVVALAAFGNFTLEGFFLHVANLAERYNSADAARRLSFQHTLLIVTLIALGMITLFRRASLARVFVGGLRPTSSNLSAGGHHGN